MEYPIVVVALPADEGGGFAAYVPDLPGCMSDGETRPEAIQNAESAIDEWIDAANERGLKVPLPGSAGERARNEQAKLAAKIKEIAENVDHIELRLQDLEAMARSIQERLENDDAWERFAELTGGAVIVRRKSPRQAIC